jgi:hypothetical protein
MLARCYRCQNTFSTEAFGVQKCPSCGEEIYLPEPGTHPASRAEPTPTPAPAEEEAGPRSPPQAEPQPAGQPEGEKPPAAAAGSGEQPAGMAPPIPPPGAGGPGWGPPPPGWTTPGSGWGAAPSVAPAEVEQSAPFAERAQHGFFASLAQTWRLAAVEPVRFFRQVRVDETASALLFGVICTTLGNWAALVFSYATASATKGFWVEFSQRMGGRFEALPILRMMQGFTLSSFLIQAVLSPVLALVGIYVMAGIFHVFLLMVRAAPRRFDATLTVAAYASALFLLRALPVCGGLLGTVWFAVVAILGLAEAQRCGPGKAAFAVLMPLVAACLVACAAGMIAAIAVGAGGGGGTPSSTGL